MTWKRLLLKDVCEVFADGDWVESKDQSTEGIRLIQTGNIGFGFFKDKEDKSRFVSNETFKRLKCTEIFAGDLLVSRLPDPVGKSCIIPEINSRMITGVDCTILRPKDFLNSNFLCYYQMSQNYLKDVNKGISGSTRQRISRKNLGLIEVPIPPLKEQQRIVAILDETFAKIEKAKANAEQNLKNAKELFEGYLQGVFENKGDDWVVKKLKELYQIGSSKRVLKSQWKTEGIPFYRGREITKLAANGFVENELYISEMHFAELLQKTGVPKTGDIVMTAIGTIGNTHIVRDFDKFYFKDASVLWLKRVTDTSSEFTKYFLKSSLFFKQLDKGNGATVDTLTIDKLQNIELFIPTLKTQQIIVEKLDSLSEETKKIEAIYEQKVKDLDELKKSILNKAFNGEL
jgi:type I restriction enzyme S subunit